MIKINDKKTQASIPGEASNLFGPTNTCLDSLVFSANSELLISVNF